MTESDKKRTKQTTIVQRPDHIAKVKQSAFQTGAQRQAMPYRRIRITINRLQKSCIEFSFVHVQ